MASNIPGLTTTFRAGGAIGKRLLVKHGASNNAALQASAATDALIGVSTDVAAASDAPVDVIRLGIAPVVYGGTVARGDALTADANGKAIKAATGNRIVGFAEVSGVANDIGAVAIAPGFAA